MVGSGRGLARDHTPWDLLAVGGLHVEGTTANEGGERAGQDRVRGGRGVVVCWSTGEERMIQEIFGTRPRTNIKEANNNFVPAITTAVTIYNPNAK